jgi:hypothetical protein
MASRSRDTVWSATAGAALLTVWLLSTEPFGLGVVQLLAFTAPGALLGLGAGWMAHATRRSAWNWQSARTAALFGAGTLPPVLAFLIAIEGSARPQQLLVGFVHAAWLALAGGGVAAALHKSRRRSRRPSEQQPTTTPLV